MGEFVTYRGTIKNGVVVLERSASLPEGAAVEVTELETAARGELPAFGIWKDRCDLPDSAVAARQLRARVEQREG